MKKDFATLNNFLGRGVFFSPSFIISFVPKDSFVFRSMHSCSTTLLMTSNLLRDGRTSFPSLQEKFTASPPPRGVAKAVTTDSSITVINNRRR
jgi:hypothetical protein